MAGLRHRFRRSGPRVLSAAMGLLLTTGLALPVGASASSAASSGGVTAASRAAAAGLASGGAAAADAGAGAWHHIAHRPTPNDDSLSLNAGDFTAWSLDRDQIANILDTAPRQYTRAADQHPLVVALPGPDGAFQRFALTNSPIMEKGLAAKYPDIQTYSGIALDDPGATIRADLTPLGFHASVRSPYGAWYIDPFYQNDDTVYASYFGRNLDNGHGVFAERDADGQEISADSATYHAKDTVTISGSTFAPDTDITLTITDPEGNFADRTVTDHTDGQGNFKAKFVADPDGNLDMHLVTATDGNISAGASYQVITTEDLSHDPPTGDILRTYRLALITDPGYATYFGDINGATPSVVEAAKVTLINRVDQIYNDDMSIQLTLIANDDQLNLDTWSKATAPNGPCGAAACFTQSQVTGCSSTTRARIVIGQIIGAANYDMGHLALGQPGGGVANLGVVGRSGKAGGCTGIPTPTGDYYAVDYVAHEMGHQFSGNHSYNGTQFNCSTSNRNGATSVEPGSGSSVMAYAGICLTDDLSRHSDPYFSQRSQQEITTYVSGTQTAVNQVQTASLLHFGGGNEVQTVTFGPGFQTALTIQPLSVAIGAANSGPTDFTNVGGISETGNVVTVSTGNVGAATTLTVGDQVTISGVPVAGYNGGPYTVTSTPSSRGFTFTSGTTGLANSGGGSFTLVAPGLSESGNTALARTTTATGLSVGNVVVITGAGVGAYNGNVVVTGTPTAKSFTYTPNPNATTVTAASNASGTIASFTSSAHGLFVGQSVTVSGLSNAAYNGTWTVATVPTSSTFTADIGTSGNPSLTAQTGSVLGSGLGLPNSGAGTATFTPGFQINIGGQESAVIGGSNQAYNNANLTASINAISGFAGTATATGAASTGFTVTYTGASAGLDVPNFSIDNLSCNGCYSHVDETTHGGAFDSFTVNYNGTNSAVITNGTNYTAAALQTAIQALTGGTVAVAGFGGGTFNNTGFQVTFSGTNANTNLNTLTFTNLSGSTTGWFGVTDKGGNDSRGGIQTSTGNAIPVVNAGATYTIPYRTPFTLTGSATDADNDPLTYSWEQNDVGPNATGGGTGLVFNNKVNGPLFAMFPVSSQIDDTCSLTFNCNEEQAVGTNPSRTFPDLQQIINNNTDADTGACTTAPIIPPVPQSIVECFSEYLPTASYLGQGSNASPPRLNFRLTARDGKGGDNNGNTTLTLAVGTGPFLVTAPNTAVSWQGGSSQSITWNVAGTDANGINTANVKISLSTDGGHTYPTVLDASTPNDGSDSVTLPNVISSTARVKVEAVGNIFFDISNADFSITKADTTTTLNSDVNPSVFGQSVAFTATVSGAGTTPTGTVQFNVDGSDVGSPVAVAGDGTATKSLSNLDSAGSPHSVTATYSGDSLFNGSASVAYSQTVNKADTSISITNGTDLGGSTVVGQSYTVKWSVLVTSPGNGTPTGTVTVSGGSGCTAPVGDGQCDLISTDAGSKTLSASYAGDANFNTSNTASGTGHTVNPADTTTTVTSNHDPSVHGQAVKFTATVAASAPGAGTPTGSVQFKIDGADFGVAVALDGSGNATSDATSSLTTGTHTIVAVYSSDANFNTSTSANFTQHVNQAATATTVTSSSHNPSVHGQSVSFTAHAAVTGAGAGTPTGTIQFKVDGTDLGAPVALDGSGNANSPATTSLSTASHTITAVYSGDTDFSGSTSANFSQTVNKAATTSTVTASNHNPSSFGQGVQFTALVVANAPGSGTVTGSVQFKVDGVSVGSPVALDGTGHATSAVISNLVAGNHNIRAAFTGSTDFSASSSVGLHQSVHPAATSVAVTVTPEPSTFSHSFKVLATVTSVAPGHGTPTGQVQLYVDGAKTGAKVTLSGGKATITVNIALTRGNHAIVVKFLGSANFSTSHSATVTHHIL